MRLIFQSIPGLLLLIGFASAQTEKKPPSTPPEKKAADDNSSEPKSPELTVLDRFAGPWEVSESHYNARGDTVGSARGTEEGAWILDGRALRRTYTTGHEGHLYRAIGVITWDPTERQYEGAWFDNTAANGLTSVTGTWDEAAKTMTFTLASSATDGKSAQYKVIDRFLDDEHRVVTTYRVNGNQVEKAIEVQFKRARPCPQSIGILPENTPPAKP